MKNRKFLGAMGERMALVYLFMRGWWPVRTNLYLKGGEVDLLVRRGRHFRLIEVRTRSGDWLDNPLDAVGTGKIRRVFRLADRLAPRVLASPEHRMSVDLIVVVLRWGWWPRLIWVRDLERPSN